MPAWFLFLSQPIDLASAGSGIQRQFDCFLSPGTVQHRGFSRLIPGVPCPSPLVTALYSHTRSSCMVFFFSHSVAITFGLTQVSGATCIYLTVFSLLLSAPSRIPLHRTAFTSRQPADSPHPARAFVFQICYRRGPAEAGAGGRGGSTDWSGRNCYTTSESRDFHEGIGHCFLLQAWRRRNMHGWISLLHFWPPGWSSIQELTPLPGPARSHSV